MDNVVKGYCCLVDLFLDFEEASTPFRFKALKFSILFIPVDTGRKLNVHKTFRRRPESLLNVLCTFNLRPVPTGQESHTFTIKRLIGFHAGTYN